MGAAIASVLGQTFSDLDVFVVDDGSSDGTDDVVRNYTDPRLVYHRFEDRAGVSRSRNYAITNSDSEFVAFLDDDDQWLPHKLQAQVRLLETSRVAVGCVYAGHYAVDRATRRIVRAVTPRHRGNIFNALCIGNCIGTASTVIVRRRALAQVGSFEEGIDFGEDHDLWLRMAAHFLFDYVREPLVYYNLHGGNTTHRYDVVIRDLERRLVRYAHLYEANRTAACHSYRELGQLYCQTGSIHKGRQALLEAIRRDPLSVKCYYDFGLSLLGSAGFRTFKESKERLGLAARKAWEGIARIRSGGARAVAVREPVTK